MKKLALELKLARSEVAFALQNLRIFRSHRSENVLKYISDYKRFGKRDGLVLARLRLKLAKTQLELAKTKNLLA
jgi:hypothetical protein